MAGSQPRAMRLDFTDSVVDIVGEENFDEAARQKLADFFEETRGEIKSYIEEEIDGAIGENEELKAAEKKEKEEEAKHAEENAEKNAKQAQKENIFDAASNAVDHLRAIRKITAPIRHNKWREPQAKLTAENIKIIGKIAEGGFASVYLIENTDTKLQYAMKLQGVREGDDDPLSTPPKDTGAPTPPITPSSEATKVTENAIRRRHLLSKRFNETKCYLQYIRSSTPLICNLEAFFDLRDPGDIVGMEEELAYAHIFEYCDWGTLDNVVKKYYETPRWGIRRPGDTTGYNIPEGMPEIYKHAAIPEAFIWHVYMQAMEGLAFLHGDHELNREKKFHRHTQIIVIDLKLDNIFLKSPNKRGSYPDVKLADFGEATYVEHGKSRWKGYGTGILAPPEEPWLSAKYDVWCLGIALHILSHSGRQPVRPGQQKSNRDYSVEPDWTMFDPHLSRDLCRELERPREMDVNKRWTAFQIWQHIKPLAEERIPLMYRRLQNWAKPEIDIEFEEGYLEWVDNGGTLSEDEEENDENDDDDAGGGDDPLSTTVIANTKQQTTKQTTKQPEKKPEKTTAERLKRQREEDEREKENLSPLRFPKRRLMRYRKLRAYRI